MASTKQFAMPVVLQNLPPAETLNQMVDNLNYLCRVFDEAFDAIQTQISDERKKILSIQDRVQKANEQTELIAKYPNKSTTVHSHCQFPETNESNEKYKHLDKPLVSMTEKIEEVSRGKYKLSISQRLQKPPACQTLKLYAKISESTKSKNTEKIEGLGTLPSWIESVGNTLLFNTDQNPYLKYETQDNLFGEDRKDRDKKETQMFAAPKTITDRKYLNMDEKYQIDYQPELENVPTFNAPQQLNALSGLGNLALDLKWGNKNQTNADHKIAPSGVDFADLPELEQLPDFADEFGFGDYDTPGNGNNDLPPAKPATPPPAPPKPTTPPPPKPIQTLKQEEIKPEPPKRVEPVTKTGAAAPIAKKDPNASRNNLLASIRAGASLKKPNKKVNNKKPAAKKLPPKPLNMMDQLKLRLQARNKTMSGQGSVVKEKKNEMAPPNLNDDDDDNNNNNNKSFNLKPSNTKKRIDTKTDNTGLGLDNLPSHMKASMLIVDDDDDGTDDDDDWE